MLCQFTVSNYKSIYEAVTLDMQATAVSEHEKNIIKDKDGDVFLPLTVLYGANGSGKSNILDALQTLLETVLAPLEEREKKLPVVPFYFSRSAAKHPTEFEIFFRTENAEYCYVLQLKEGQIFYESLNIIRLDTRRSTSLFERKEKITLKGAFGKIKIPAEIPGNLPFLSYLGLYYKKNELVKDIFSWMKQQICFLSEKNLLEELKIALKNPETSERIRDILRELQLGIWDIQTEIYEEQMEIWTIHKVRNQEYRLRLKEESDGTQRIIYLLPVLLQCMTKGYTLVADSLEQGLHTEIIRYIITLFHNPKINQAKAQLIFTSQDISSMCVEVFRRDEIWFAEKGELDNTVLYSLVELKNGKGEAIRKDAKFDKQYLEGKYGAFPKLREQSQEAWILKKEEEK